MKKVNEKGFTLAELLIVVAVIAVLVAVAIPTFANQLEKARQAVDVSNLRGAYAAAKLAAMDGQINGSAIESTKYYYYNPDTGTLTDVSEISTFDNYGKATSNRIVADVSNLNYVVFYDDAHIGANDKHILVNFAVSASKVYSVKQISFESGSACTPPPAFVAASHGDIISIDAAWTDFAKVTKGTDELNLSSDTTAEVLVTAKDTSGSKVKCLAKMADLATKVQFSYNGATAADLAASDSKIAITHFSSDTTKQLTFTGKSDADPAVTGTVVFDIVAEKN